MRSLSEKYSQSVNCSFVLTVRVAMPNARDQRRAAKGLSTTLDFIASPLHRLVLRLFTHRRPDAPSGFP